MSNILKKIIEEGGSCTNWARKSICERCPLSKLKKKADGNYLSCVEALKVEDMDEATADARYKDVAARILLDEAIDEILGGPDVSK